MTTLSTYLGYRDADAAITWLETALGFETTMRHPDDQGGVAHAELRAGDAVVVVFTDRHDYRRPPRRPDTCGQGLYLTVAAKDDVDTAHTRALAAGATSVWTPEATDWDNYRCRVLDPEGFEWTVGTHQPGLPAQW